MMEGVACSDNRILPVSVYDAVLEKKEGQEGQKDASEGERGRDAARTEPGVGGESRRYMCTHLAYLTCLK